MWPQAELTLKFETGKAVQQLFSALCDSLRCCGMHLIKGFQNEDIKR